MVAPLAVIVPAAVGLIQELIKCVGGDKKQQAEMICTQLTQAHELSLAQIEINKAEAQHQSIFVAGWRPFIGWVLGAALCYQFILLPFLTWYAQYHGVVVPPSLDDMLWELVTGLLGMGTLRTLEKTATTYTSKKYGR